MKLLRKFTIGLALAMLAFVWAGCQMQHKSVMPLSDGYEEVSHPNRGFIVLAEAIPPRISLSDTAMTTPPSLRSGPRSMERAR